MPDPRHAQQMQAGARAGNELERVRTRARELEGALRSVIRDCLHYDLDRLSAYTTQVQGTAFAEALMRADRLLRGAKP